MFWDLEWQYFVNYKIKLKTKYMNWKSKTIINVTVKVSILTLEICCRKASLSSLHNKLCVFPDKHNYLNQFEHLTFKSHQTFYKIDVILPSHTLSHQSCAEYFCPSVYGDVKTRTNIIWTKFDLWPLCRTKPFME